MIRRTTHLLIGVLLGVLTLLPQLAADASSIEIQQTTIDGTVIVDEVVSQFPEGLDFRFEAELSESVQRAELLYTIAGSETANLAWPEIDPGTSVVITHFIELLIRFQPSGVDFTYWWRLHTRDGGVFESEPQTILWYDDRFEWDSFASDDITVHSYNGDTAFNEYILESAQTTADMLKEEFDLPDATRIRIWIYDARSDFYETQAPNSSEWIAGTAFPSYHLIIATIPRGDYREVDRVIPHEVSHQIVGEATKNPFNALPTWLDEGLAVEVQEVGTADYPAVVADAYLQGRLPTVQSLISDFPFDAGHASLAYASSYSIVTFIRETYGEDQLRALVLSYREGISHDEALMQTLGITTSELDSLWRYYVGANL
jgi:hypothetical protein